MKKPCDHKWDFCASSDGRMCTKCGELKKVRLTCLCGHEMDMSKPLEEEMKRIAKLHEKR